ncbi:MAG: hypothetical protein EZS28_038905, partial [Streblomastix strix]
TTQNLYLQGDQQRNLDANARKEGAWPVRSQAQIEQERAQERRSVSIMDIGQRLMAEEQDNRDKNQEKKPNFTLMLVKGEKKEQVKII